MNNQKVWALALGVSLTVNVFVMAVLLTGWLRPGFSPDGPEAPVPPRARELFHQVSDRGRPGDLQALRRIRQQHDMVRSALAAEPFDENTLETAFAGLREAQSGAAERAHRRILEVAGTLPAEERRQLARMVGRQPAVRLRLPVRPAE